MRRSERRILGRCGRIAGVALLPWLAAGCAFHGSLADYDFRDRGIALTALDSDAPEVEVVTQERTRWWEDAESEEDIPGFFELLVPVVAHSLRYSGEEELVERLAEAANGQELAERIGLRLLREGWGPLGAHHATDPARADLELRTRIRRHGVEISSSSEEPAFYLQARSELVDHTLDRVVWRVDCRASSGEGGEPLFENEVVDDLLLAADLSALSTEQLEGGFERLADRCVEQALRELSWSVRSER